MDSVNRDIRPSRVYIIYRSRCNIVYRLNVRNFGRTTGRGVLGDGGGGVGGREIGFLYSRFSAVKNCRRRDGKKYKTPPHTQNVTVSRAPRLSIYRTVIYSRSRTERPSPVYLFI